MTLSLRGPRYTWGMDSRRLTPLGRGAIFGAVALFALAFVLQGVRILDKGHFAVFLSQAGLHPRYAPRLVVDPPHATLIAAAFFALAAAILLWGSLVLRASPLRALLRRRAIHAGAAFSLIAAAFVLFLPPWLLAHGSWLLLAYPVAAAAAVLLRLRPPARGPAWLGFLAALAGLWAWAGRDVLVAAAAGLALALLGALHLAFARAPEG